MDETKDTSNSEFTDERVRDSRPKICTNKKVIVFSIISLISAAAVVALVYFFGPNISRIKNFTYDPQILQEESFERMLQKPWLPKNVVPKYYRLRVQPNFEDSFTGQVTIALDCNQDTNIIILHSENLNLTHVTCTTTKAERNTNETSIVKDVGSLPHPEIKSSNVEISETVLNHSKLLLKFEEALVKDRQYFLNIHFNGGIAKNNIGILDNQYVDETGRRKSFISTNFQPFYARNAFPCFDEIGFNAHFEVSVAKRTNMVALSNTCMRETEAINKSPGLVWNHFEVTPSIPAHQVGFAVGEMKSVNASSKKAGPVVKVWARKPLLAQTKYVSSIASDILNFIRDYFGVNFPLPKLDLVLVPHLGREAEGSLGLIFFRESALLSFNKIDSDAKKRIFNLISESIIHQWSDTYLTKNWATFWINRGLSIYLTYVAQTALLNPSGLDHFGLEVLRPALSEDGTRGISLFKEIKQEEDVLKVFDYSVGRKAGSVLRMINDIFGEKSFRKGFVNYIKNRNVSETETLSWDTMHITDSLGKNVSVEETLKSWSQLSGFPLVIVTRNYETSMIKIQQIKFGNMNSGSEMWTIPLTYRIQGDMITSVVVLDQKGMKINSTVNSDEWVLFNWNQIGYYRVNYDMDNWNMIIQQLKDNHTEILLPNRVQLVNDAFELANFGYMRHTMPFKLITYLENEVNYAPWRATIDALDWIGSIISETKHFGIYKKYMLRLLNSEDKIYNFTEVNTLDTLQINEICRLRYKPCTAKALKLFEDLFQNNTQKLTVPLKFRHTIYCLGIESGTEEYWDIVWELSKNATPDEKAVMYYALGCSREMWKLTSYLEKTLTGSIELEFVEIVWRSLARKPIGRLVGVDFLENRWEDIYSSYKSNPNLIRVIIEQFLSNLSTDIHLKKVAVFYSKHRSDLKPMSEAMKEALTKIKMRVSWKEKFFDAVLPLLSPNGTNSKEVW